MKWLQKHHPEAVPAGHTTPHAGVSSNSVVTKPKATPFADLSNRISTSNSSNDSGQSSSSGSTVSMFIGLFPERTPSKPSTVKSSGVRVLASVECLSLATGRKGREIEERERGERATKTDSRNKQKKREEEKQIELKREQERLQKSRKKRRERKQRRQPNKQLKSQNIAVLAQVARDLLHVIVPKIVPEEKCQNCQRSTTLTLISVAFALDFMRMMWVLVVNGSNAAVRAGFMRTVWKILCVTRMERKKLVLYVFLKF